MARLRRWLVAIGVTAAVVVVAVALLLRQADVARHSVADLKTRGQLRQIGQAITLWAVSNDGKPPRVESWVTALTQKPFAGKEQFDSLRIRSEPGAAVGNELIYSPLLNAEGTLAPLMDYPRGGLGWIIVREDESRLPASLGVLCVTIEDGAPFTTEVDRVTLAKLLESQEKSQRERFASNEAR